MSKSRKLRAAFKAIFEPAMREAGYDVAYPNFCRAEGEVLHLVMVQPWTYGGAFTIEFGVQRGPFHNGNDELVPPETLEVDYLPLPSRARLGPGEAQPKRDRSPSPDHYAYARIADDRAALDELMREVAGHIPQIDAWLRDGTVSPNIHPYD
ncbi:DUF4304 domain-containing protein [Pontivivens ytuae]|uniref:DUF4304 domain-containing protein n=1 Tax=Pontivivens ytuae TaxID=2789856 RepID=A0A7S9LSB9_9RHOB|nr:DUF4304 domain-containing protein [Pontivivens ytuae]QPH54406.1 DUF4304 domain-containing protein [Pontivivens ytuae]